ncbi:MAG: chloride channel protein [Intestinibacillus sp.]
MDKRNEPKWIRNIRWRRYLREWRVFLLQQSKAFLKWFVFSCIIGLLVGAAGAAFHHAIAYAEALRNAHGWLLILLPVIGAFIVFLYRVCGMERDRGTNFVLIAVRENEPMRLLTAPLIFISTVLSHLAGASVGREGAALQLGGAISSKIGRMMHLDEKDARVVTMCGMAAGFSALFGTPLTAAVFAMEVVSVGVMYYAAVFPCMFGALLAHRVATLLGNVQPVYVLRDVPGVDLPTMLRIVALGCLCALLSIAICWALKGGARLYGRFLESPYLRIAVGGCLVVLVTLMTGTRDYNGAGMDVIARAIGAQARPEAFALKILLTTLSLGAGYKGGEILPVFFTGATFGCVMGALVGLPPSFGASLGMAATFCGVTNCPLSSILLAYELFGGAGLPLFGLVCAVSYMLSGYTGLYSEQKIMYGKLRPEFIGRKIKH